METMFKFLNFNRFKHVYIKFLRNSLISIKNIRNLNFLLLMGYFITNRNWFHNKFNKTAYSSTLNIDYLMPFDFDKFESHKGPKILYIPSMKSFSPEENLKVQQNFEKLHSKFSELKSFILDKGQTLNTQEYLRKIIGNELNFEDKKPFVFINKYGDIKFLSQEEFEEVTKQDSIFPFFDKLSILNNINDLLMTNDYDFVFMIYLDNSKIDYTLPIFKTFRKIFHTLNFFNVKFFVATTEHTNFLPGLKENNVYLVKRDNMILNDEKRDIVDKDLRIDNENLEFLNLTEEFAKLNTQAEDFYSNLTKILLHKANFMYYVPTGFRKKQGMEVLNLYFKDIPYYLLFTNLKEESNRIFLEEIFSAFKEKATTFKDVFAFIVVDNEKNKKNVLFKTFKDKVFDLKEYTLKKAKFADEIQHYEPNVLKKIKLKDFSRFGLLKFIDKEDVAFEENYLFRKKLPNLNFQMMNHVLFESRFDQQRKNILVLKSKDEKKNRHLMRQIESIANKDNKSTYWHMLGNEKNIDLIKKKFNYQLNDDFPKLIVINKENLKEISTNGKGEQEILMDIESY